MKKLSLLLVSLLLPVLGWGQNTLRDMSTSQINQILGNCNKIVVETFLLMDNGEYRDVGNRPHEKFQIIIDYPYAGCDFYIGGDDHGYYLSRPMNAQRGYADKNGQSVSSAQATRLQFHFFDNKFKNNVVGFDFSEESSSGFPTVDLLFYYQGKISRIHRILSVDFYDKANNVIAKGYCPSLEKDKENGNLLRCFIDSAYNKYK